MKSLTKALIGTAVAALALSPLGASASAAPSDDRTIGPAGYKDLRLSMPEYRASSTGLLTDRQDNGQCNFYYLRSSEGKPNPGGGVFVSETNGVVMIAGTDKTHTPEGIGFGTPFHQVDDAYPELTPADGMDWIFETSVPGNPDAKYRFAFSESGKVSDFALTAKDTGGCTS